MKKPVAFISYAHEDKKHLKRLTTGLAGLRRRGLIEEWHDREIRPGQEREEAIDENLETSEIILLLITPDFMSSDYAVEKEMSRALERHDRGEARVIPIIVRPTDWEGAPFDKLQMLPRDAKPINEWSNRDRAWLEVVRGIQEVVKELVPELVRSPDPTHTPRSGTSGSAPSGRRLHPSPPGYRESQNRPPGDHPVRSQKQSTRESSDTSGTYEHKAMPPSSRGTYQRVLPDTTNRADGNGDATVSFNRNINDLIAQFESANDEGMKYASQGRYGEAVVHYSAIITFGLTYLTDLIRSANNQGIKLAGWQQYPEAVRLYRGTVAAILSALESLRTTGPED